MKAQDKMRIRHQANTYEGLPAASAVGMALFESLGLGRLIDERCRYDPAKRKLSPGMVTKILLGPTFNIRNKYPLYLVNKAYTQAPLDRICGPGVEAGDLTDYSLARGLDTLFGADLTELFKDCQSRAVERLGTDSKVYHMDSTDISFYGMEHLPDRDGASVPKHNGHPKDGHPELLQYELQVVADSDSIIRYMKTYDGNVPDSIMDRETIADLTRIFTPEERSGITLVGDCKLASQENILAMIDSGFGFVSKCAVNFKDGAFERARRESVEKTMHSCGKRGLWMSDTDLAVKLSGKREVTLRFVSFRWDVKVGRREAKIREDTADRIRRAENAVQGLRFPTEEDALEYAEGLADRNGFYRIRAGTRFCRTHRRSKTGWWELDLSFEISDRRIRRQAELDSTVVLVSNLGRMERSIGTGRNADPCGNDGYGSAQDPVDGKGRRRPVTDEEILAIYNREYKVERAFALMKSGIGMNTVYVQKPSRENAMMFVICIGVLLSNIADAMFRRADTRLEGRPMTMYRLSHELQTTLVTYSRCDNSLSLLGPPEVTERFFGYTDTLGINPQLLLGYLTE